MKSSTGLLVATFFCLIHWRRGRGGGGMGEGGLSKLVQSPKLGGATK